MAKLHSNFFFTGSLGNLSAYKRRDLDTPILRTQGGASKEKIKTAPEFEITRKLNAEFGGCSTAAKLLRLIMWPQKALADYNTSAALTALAKKIMVLDTQNEYGQRSILLSKNPQLLAGFNFNKIRLFDSVIRVPIPCTLSRTALTAQVDIPALIPGINLFVPNNYSWYAIVTSLGIMPDMRYSQPLYEPMEKYERYLHNLLTDTPWYSVLTGSAATTLNIQLPYAPPATGAYSLVFSIGIRFGTIGIDNTIHQVKHAGSAKILAMA